MSSSSKDEYRFKLLRQALLVMQTAVPPALPAVCESLNRITARVEPHWSIIKCCDLSGRPPPAAAAVAAGSKRRAISNANWLISSLSSNQESPPIPHPPPPSHLQGGRPHSATFRLQKRAPHWRQSGWLCFRKKKKINKNSEKSKGFLKDDWHWVWSDLNARRPQNLTISSMNTDYLFLPFKKKKRKFQFQFEKTPGRRGANNFHLLAEIQTISSRNLALTDDRGVKKKTTCKLVFIRNSVASRIKHKLTREPRRETRRCQHAGWKKEKDPPSLKKKKTFQTSFKLN